MKKSLRINDLTRSAGILALIPVAFISCLAGCATAPMETHRKGLESITEEEYFIPKKPVDRPFIGCAWSKQFGPIEDPATSDIRIKVERSFSGVQQMFAYNVGVSLGGQSTWGGLPDPKGKESTKGGGPSADLGVEAGASRKSELENVQVISPVSLADIPFEPNLPYITEALRLGNFRLKSESAGKAGVTVQAGSVKGGVKGSTESAGGTTGEGLVVAYRLHMIDPTTYSKQDSGSVALELDKAVDFPQAGLVVRPQLRVIEAGSNKPLPRDLLWSCARADAQSRDMVAAWVIELRPKDPRRKSLQIAFPAFPKIDDCQHFRGVIYSRIDPLTDKIIRERIDLSILQEDLSDSLKPVRWEAGMSVVDESFNIKLVKQGDLAK